MYFITTIDSKDDDARCVGYYESFKTAEAAVFCNAFDICETCYDYCVIENIPIGMYMYDTNPRWYKYNKETGGYYRVMKEEIPKKYRNQCGFAIG